MHIDREISQLSKIEGEAHRKDLIKFQEDKSKIVNLNEAAERHKQQLNKSIERTYREIDSISLGMEHLFRELGKIYEICCINKNSPFNKIVMDLPGQYAELLLQGHAIEILDGDIGEINSSWFGAITQEVEKRSIKKDLKIFVVSILGLQSSGKSTLLNALFWL